MRNKENIVLAALLRIALLQALVILLAGLNLYLTWSNCPLADSLQVRWREVISLLVVTPAGIVLLFAMHRTLEYGRKDAAIPLLVLVLGSCWLAISMGIHEPINAFRQQMGHIETPSSRLLWFWDDVFSHMVFFAGYAASTIAILWSQKRNPLKHPMPLPTFVLFMIYGVISGIGITYSLAPGAAATVDLVVIAGVLVAAEIMRKGHPFRQHPVNIVVEASYLLPLIMLTLKIIYH